MRIARRSRARGTVALTMAVLVLFGCLLAGTGTAAAVTNPGAPGGPRWELSPWTMPTNFKPGENGNSYLVAATNVGGVPTSGTRTVTLELPDAGVTYVSAMFWHGFSLAGDCSHLSGTVTCTGTTAIKPGEQVVVQVVVDVLPSAEGTLVGQASVSGGGAPADITAPVSTPVGGDADPGFAPGTFFSATSSTQAGAHPNATAGFQLNTVRRTDTNGNVLIEPAGGSLRDISVDTPPGLIGSTTAAPKCTFAQFSSERCPASSIVGMENIQLSLPGPYAPGGMPFFIATPLYNLTPPAGVPAQFGFRALTVSVILRAEVRSGGDYGLTVSVGPNSQGGLVFGASTMFYGVPSANNGSGTSPVPFLTNPTACGSPLTSSASAAFYQRPELAPATAISAPTTWTGCERVPFAPSLELRPQTSAADSPTGLDVDLHLPQSQEAEGLSSAALKEARVQLPEGLVVNPASAAGLGACSEAQAALHDAAPAQCPDNAKIGSVEIETPLLDHPMTGGIYVATPHQNPFGTLLAMYLTIDDPKTGITLKLPGRIDAHPATGQLTATVSENPQLPFEHVSMRFFGGPRAALKTPQACGTHTTSARLVPWSAPAAPDADVTDSFTVDRGAGGGACSHGEASEPNQPRFDAGSVFTQAGADTPMVVRLRREDGSQRFGALSMGLPEGLLARLAGTPYCADDQIAAAGNRSGAAELANPSCPAASQVGRVTVGAGAGSQPYYVEGGAYLAGPYKGAPLSLAFVTPAVAGPFDLGTVVVRAALDVDPVTARVSVRTDPIPSILKGIPLDLRSLAVHMDRPGFTRNPTSCAEKAFAGQALSLVGQPSALFQRFQVGGCRGLDFKPRLSLRLKGKTNRSAHPALTATLKARSGDANIGKSVVTLPKTQFLEQGHIRTICTRVQYAEGNCPKASIYGYAKAWTPLLDQPLQGPVYLRSSSNTLPDLVADLDGQIEIDLAGRIDSVNSRMRTTFWAVPDAPVSKFVLRMQGGRKGLLVNNTELCEAKPRASAVFTGHNGKLSASSPLVKVGCGKGAGPRE